MYLVKVISRTKTVNGDYLIIFSKASNFKPLTSMLMLINPVCVKIFDMDTVVDVLQGDASHNPDHAYMMLDKDHDESYDDNWISDTVNKMIK